MEFFAKAELLSREEIDNIQIVRLRNTVERAKRSPHYGRVLKGFDPASIRSMDDVRRLPLTTKQDLRDNYPYGLLTCHLDDVVRLHASSGTTGNPTVIFYTQNDVDTWADLMARCMHMAGVRRSDRLQNMAGYGLFTGGLGFHYGSERLGCLTIPSGAGNTARQIKMITDFDVSVLHIIPSYALYFAGALEQMGIDPSNKEQWPVRIAMIGAEPHTEEVRRKIEEMLCVKAYNSYGLSEMNGPGVAFECECQTGMHVWEDAFLVEILDPETQQPVAEGEIGEVVLTTLTREAMPIIRYRTKDLSRFLPGQCACGRVHRRLDRIKGRADDMIIIKGVNIYPMQIEQVLMALPEVGENYVIVLERDGFIDQIRIKVEIKEEHFVEDMRVLSGLQKMIQTRLRDEILVTPRVDLVQSDSLPKSQGKAQRVIDERPKED